MRIVEDEKIGKLYFNDNNELHREDGPASILYDGKSSYYLNDEYMEYEEWQEKVFEIRLNRLKKL